MVANEKTKIITFYSYKGGAGRSSTALNTLPYLVQTFNATPDRPLLLMDMDLDSAGMTYLLGLEDYFQTNFDVKTLISDPDSIRWTNEQTEDLASHPLLSKFMPVGRLLGVEDKSVLFLGDNDTSKIDNSEMTGSKMGIFKKLKQFCKNNHLPGLVLDSASGDQFAARIAVEYATDIVVCMRPTMQFRAGTFGYLKRLAADGLPTNIILLPTVVPQDDIKINEEYQKSKAIANIRKRAQNWMSGLQIYMDFICEETFGINEVQRFKWEEGVLYKIGQKQPLLPDENTACARYKQLAELLASTGG